MKNISTNTIGLAQKVERQKKIKLSSLKIATPVYAYTC